jgi:hypothetical protein
MSSRPNNFTDLKCIRVLTKQKDSNSFDVSEAVNPDILMLATIARTVVNTAEHRENTESD